MMFDWNGGGRIVRWLGITALVTVPILGGCEQMEGGREGREEQQTGESRGERLQQEAREASQQQEELLGRQQDLQGEAQEARQQQEELAQRERQLEGQLQQTEQQLQQEQARSQQLGQQTEQFEQQREQQLAQQQQREQSQQQQQDVQRQQQQAQREQQQAQQDQQRMQQEQQRTQQEQQQLAQQDQQRMQQQQQPMQQQQQPMQQPQGGQQGATGALGGAAAGAAVAGRQQQQGQGGQQPAIEGQVRGTVQQVDVAQGTLVIDAQGQRVRLRAQPSDIAELNQGDSVTLPFASFGDAQWVISEGGGQEMTQMFRGTQRLQGVVSNVDKNNGTITIEGREISGHPQQLAQVMPGQSVSVQVAQVENTPWIAELQTSGATAQLGQQQQQGAQQQGEQPAQG